VHVAVAGSAGLIGNALVRALEADGHRVGRMVRPASEAGGSIEWDPVTGRIDAAALEGVDAVVNLAGRSIGERRWDAEEKRLVRSSRVDSTRLLAETLASSDRMPRVLVNASAVGFYGDRGDEVLDESAPAGESFFAGVCRDWEAATAPAAAAGVRVVCIRSGIVLSERGGALGRLLAPFGPSWISPYRWGLGGWIGRGDQWWSWISLADEVRAIRHLLDSTLSGPVNLVAPAPATNREFMKAVGRALHRPVWYPIPRFVLRIVLGSGLAEATLFEGQRVVPRRLRDDGFAFTEPGLDDALAQALAQSGI
jgi:uncharacterized protein (TIGR01777 family)